MGDDELTPQALSDRLSELARFLDGRSDFWADRVRQAAQKVYAGRVSGARLFLSFHGGMGSLNDLQLSPHNGNASEGEDLRSLNDQLRELDERIYVLAAKVVRESDRLEHELRARPG